jgi:flagellar biosynthesis GTPase FlhF
MRKITAFTFIIAMIPVIAFAQYGDPAAILEYYDNPQEITVRNAENEKVEQVTYGMTLEPGFTVQTMNTSAELALEPNGSIIKLSRNTTFTIEGLQSSKEESNSFSLAAGKIRAVAARGGVGARYEVNTPSAVCGVRGTDFGLRVVPGTSEQAFVNKGEVQYSKRGGPSLTLTSGMVADALDETFEAIRVSSDRLQELMQDVQFQELQPDAVPGQEPERTAAEEDEEAEEEETEADEEGEAEEKAAVSEETETETREATERERSEFEKALAEALGLEIGTITIEGDTYSKAVIQPEFEIGKLKMALYLPIIYTNDLFNPNDWYKPAGNNEWSFGSDQNWEAEPLEATQDVLQDLFLKIRYIQWGEQRDPFYLKFGNLDNMTIGHGTLMENYANDIDFPAVRQLGLNFGLDSGGYGLEGVVNDAADPEVFGARFYVRPFGKLALGASSIIDANPLSANQSYADTNNINSMNFIGTGLDSELPIVENDLLSVIPFADLATMIPTINGKAQWDLVYDSGADSFMESFRNYGLTAGFFGNAAMVDWELEYRYYRGVYRPTFFGHSYERLRGTYVEKFYEYSQNPDASAYDGLVQGVYGSAQTKLFEMVEVKAGYMWPWHDGLPSDLSHFNDEFTLNVRVLPDVIPMVDLHGGFAYTRTNFAPVFIEPNNFQLFDGYTTVKGEIIYGVAPNMDIVGVISTSTVHDDDGNIVYTNGTPKVVPNITIETRVSF